MPALPARWLAVCASVLLSLLVAVPAGAKLAPDEVPTFAVRARVKSLAGQPPGEAKFTFRLATQPQSAATTGDAWSDWLAFGRPEVEANLKGYPATYLPGYPVVVRLSVSGVQDPTLVEVELRFDGRPGAVVPLSGELFGPALGILIWREAGEPRAATMADYNRRYWKHLAGVEIRPEQRPKKFPIVDRFIGGDDDRRAWQEGIAQLQRGGFSAIMLPPSAKLRDLLLAAGQTRTAWAVYSPPGYAFDYSPDATLAALAKWAAEQARPYREAGYAATDMTVFALSDEPGWYYPAQFEALKQHPGGLARFRDYLARQGLQPRDVGATRWEEVQPLGRSGAKDLAGKRLFYWTMRFFAWDSARHFAAATQALEKEFYPGLPLYTNWNFFSGRLYVPGPVANNAAKQDPDAAMGGHDWFEFARLRGCTMLWTEDWFADRDAFQWSFYCAKLRSAAAKGNLEFGGYVIPRTAGDLPDGIVRKILAIAGHGGKAVKYFVFGPEYNFPGNCYSERAEVLPQMAKAHRMIGQAEELLWPGRPPRSPVAILAPRSAQMWDAQEIAVPRVIDDATNHRLNRRTVDYMAEVFNLYLALQHANIPVEFIDEEDLTGAGLKPYRVLYVTEPNVPLEGQRALVAWVQAGGTLATCCGAARRDRYDEPSEVVAEGLGIREQPRARLLIDDTHKLPELARGSGPLGPLAAVGAKSAVDRPEAGSPDIVATFADGAPAVVHREVGKGRAVHYGFFPGLSYWKSCPPPADKNLPTQFEPALRNWIVFPTALANIDPPVTLSHPLVEAPLLQSERGRVITLLNWTGRPIDRLDVRVATIGKIGRVESVERGRLEFDSVEGAVRFSLPLEAADIVLMYP